MASVYSKEFNLKGEEWRSLTHPLNKKEAFAYVMMSYDGIFSVPVPPSRVKKGVNAEIRLDLAAQETVI